ELGCAGIQAERYPLALNSKRPRRRQPVEMVGYRSDRAGTIVVPCLPQDHPGGRLDHRVRGPRDVPCECSAGAFVDFHIEVEGTEILIAKTTGQVLGKVTLLPC